ncbi:MAG TPA: hypothetical protein VE823_00580, partial [Geodermatophilus sp.]|nr:hypothetical protein [Geodermatophilus sp.]
MVSSRVTSVVRRACGAGVTSRAAPIAMLRAAASRTSSGSSTSSRVPLSDAPSSRGRARGANSAAV